MGILAVIVQYDAAPKYCVFAYSMITYEDDFLKFIFGAHEALFLAHAWIVYGSVIYVSSVLGAELTYNLDSLKQVMEVFVDKAQTQYYRNLDRQHSELRERQFSSSPSSSSSSYSLSASDKKRSGMSSVLKMEMSLRQVRYNPMSLITDYAHVHMVVTQINNFAAYNFLYMHGCSYVQMVSDVFQMIQILRGPEADFLAVMFFVEDM